MIIAVASGKGGTGKTTIATSLALSLALNASPPLLFLDCDVEAPNAHIFLRPDLTEKQSVDILIPSVLESKCTLCARCSEVCQFNAIAVLGKKVVVFPQLCHGCGSCMLVCPEHAIKELANNIGVIERGLTAEGILFARGVLNEGEPMPVPIIRKLKKWIPPQDNQISIIDTSPGASCPVVAAVQDADFLILVTEPTPFGLHDLCAAVQISREMQIPAGVVINRENGDSLELEGYCHHEDLPVLMRVPYEREIAEGIARGQPLITIKSDYQNQFISLFNQIVAALQLKNE